MKRLFIALIMPFVAFLANAQSCPDDDHPHLIDLGLPSGTKWSCCNIGAAKPEEFGDYYAWGETNDKGIYDWSTYMYCDGSEDTCHDLGSDIAGTDYDVAHVKWGGSWVMPSIDQILELLTDCSYINTSVNGVNGGMITGPSGGTIFFPFAGQRHSDVYSIGDFCQYWASTLLPYNSRYAYVLFLSNNYILGQDDRCCGHTVRPVMSDPSNINLPESSSGKFNHAVYNIYGIKVADAADNIPSLHPGIYIINGKKMVLE